MNFDRYALYSGGAAESTFRQWGIHFSGNRLGLTDSSYFVAAGEKLPFIGTLASSGVHKLLTAVNADSIEGRLKVGSELSPCHQMPKHSSVLWFALHLFAPNRNQSAPERRQW